MAQIERIDMKSPVESDGQGLLDNTNTQFDEKAKESTPSIKLYAVTQKSIAVGVPEKYEGILVDLNTRIIRNTDYKATPSHLGNSGNSSSSNDWLTIALRKLDFCDAEGNEKSILVFASQPFEEEAT